MRPVTVIVSSSRKEAEDLAGRLRLGGLDVDGSWFHAPNMTSLIQALERDRVDLVLCRAGLPGLNPGQVLDPVRSVEEPPPVLVVSEAGDAAQILDVMATDGGERVLLGEAGDLTATASMALRECLARRERVRREKLLKFRHYFMEKAQEAILWVEPSGRVFYANEAACALLGVDRAEAAVLRVQDFVPRWTGEVFAGLWEDLRSRGGLSLSGPVLGADGVRMVEATVDHLMLEGEECAAVFMRDVTELRRAKAELESTLREKQAVFTSMVDGILSVDTELKVLDRNLALDRVCPLARELVAGAGLAGTVQGGCACPKVLRKTLDTGEAVHMDFETCAVEPDRCLDLTATPLRDEELGELAGAVLLARDVTRLHVLEERLAGSSGALGMVGRSTAMRKVFDLISQLARHDTLVLVRGESGTGKELAAEALHRHGPRAHGPLVRVNCSALSESLLESELFGHVKGAFSGAVRDREGRIRAAEGGTLVLDEVGDVSPAVQLKLLRFVETREYERVGESKPRKADVRIAASTNADLERRVAEGLFRQDLYYRLKVMTVHLPPLRERREDIPLLCSHFTALFGEAFGKPLQPPDQEVMGVFMRHAWPGNVRELKHAVEHACILCPAGPLRIAHLPPELLPDAGRAGKRKTPGPEDLKRALAEAGGKRIQAARLLGVSRATFYRLLTRYNLD